MQGGEGGQMERSRRRFEDDDVRRNEKGDTLGEQEQQLRDFWGGCMYSANIIILSPHKLQITS